MGKKFLAPILLGAMIILFQNCSSGFQALNISAQSLDSLGGSSLPTLTPPGSATPVNLQITIQNFDSSGNTVAKVDTDGNVLDIHEPYLTSFEGIYYLYGTSMACGSLASSPTSQWCGDRVYSSTDLLHWVNRGLLFDPTTAIWQSRCAAHNPPLPSIDTSCFRPKIVYNSANKQYVMWVNRGVNPKDNPTNPVTGIYYVLTSTSPIGPFTEVGPATLAQKWDNDETIYIDPATSIGYAIYMQQVDSSGNPWRLVVEQLNDSYTSGTGKYQYVSATNEIGEAPSVFAANGQYYLVYTSPPCGFCSTHVQTSYRTSPAVMGPWSEPTQLSSGSPSDANFCPGQSSGVTPITTSAGTTYLWQFDLWNSFASGSPADSGLFLAPLSFTGNAINPMRCASYPKVTINVFGILSSQSLPTGADQSSGISGFSNQCDLSGSRARAQSFKPADSTVGSTFQVSIPISQQGLPNAPVTLELQTAGTDGTPTGTVVGMASYSPQDVSWTPRGLTVKSNSAVQINQSYAIVIKSSTSQGCYNVLRQTPASYSAGFEHFSGDGGNSWSMQEAFGLMFSSVDSQN